MVENKAESNLQVLLEGFILKKRARRRPKAAPTGQFGNQQEGGVKPPLLADLKFGHYSFDWR